MKLLLFRRLEKTVPFDKENFQNRKVHHITYGFSSTWRIAYNLLDTKFFLKAPALTIVAITGAPGHEERQEQVRLSMCFTKVLGYEIMISSFIVWRRYYTRSDWFLSSLDTVDC